MDIEDAKSKAKKVFKDWYPIFNLKETEEREFEIFFSGYLAGTKYKPGPPEEPKSFQRLILGDVNRNIDL